MEDLHCLAWMSTNFDQFFAIWEILRFFANPKLVEALGRIMNGCTA